MQRNICFTELILDLFEGGAASGAATGDGSSAPAAGEQTGEALNATEQVDAGPETQEEQLNPQDREAQFREMITGEYKDQYAKEVQQIINRRFKESKALEQQISDQQGIIDRLTQRYGIEDGDLNKLGEAIDNDYSLWADAADEAGMTTEQYVKFQTLQRQNAELIRQEQSRVQQMQNQRQVQKWMADAKEVQNTFPNFNLESELANPSFASLLKNGVPMEHAYKVIHFNELQAATAHAVAGQTEKAITDNIRAKGARPAENGAQGGHGASSSKIDVHKLTPQGRQELIERARRGEIISF